MKAEWLSVSDQLVPYVVLDMFNEHPGVSGLYISAAFAGTLRAESLKFIICFFYIYYCKKIIRRYFFITLKIKREN